MNYYIVKTIEQFNKMIKYLNKFEYLSIDTETDSLNRFSKIIGISFSCAVNEGFYVPLVSSPSLNSFWTDEESIIKQINILLTSQGKKLIYHNACFDIIRLSNIGIDGESNLFADTLAMKHLIEEDFMKVNHGLKQCGEYYLGIPPTEQEDLKKSVLENGGRWLKENKDIYKANLDIIGRYACNDTNLTLQLFLKFYEMLKKEDLLNIFFNESMPLIKVTIEMESTGLQIDLNYSKNMKIFLEEEIERLDNEIYQDIKNKHSKALYSVESDILNNNYPINTNPKFYRCLMTSTGINLPESLTKKNMLKLKEDTNNHPLILWKLGEIPFNDIQNKFEEDLILTQRNLYFQDNPEEKRILNLNSGKQLADFLYNKLGETPPKQTEKGGASTDKSVLYYFKDKYPFFQKLLLRNKMNKALTSYINRFIDLNINGRFYPSFNPFKTVTARYSSDFQQIPRAGDYDDFDQGDLIKQAIVAKEGYCLVAGDLSAAEPRCFTHISKESKLINAFKNNVDPYGLLAIDIFELNCEPNDVKKLYPEKRAIAKVIFLGIVYGAGAFRVAEIAELTKDDFGEPLHYKEVIKNGQKIIDKYFKQYPQVHMFVKKSHSLAINGGYVKTLTGRKRRLPDAKKYKYKQDEQSRRIFKHLMNQAVNFQIQSLVVSIMARSMINLQKLRKKYDLDFKIIAQIHDEIVLEVKKGQEQKAMKLLKYCMENSYKLDIPLIAEPKTGLNWSQIK